MSTKSIHKNTIGNLHDFYKRTMCGRKSLINISFRCISGARAMLYRYTRSISSSRKKKRGSIDHSCSACPSAAGPSPGATSHPEIGPVVSITKLECLNLTLKVNERR